MKKIDCQITHEFLDEDKNISGNGVLNLDDGTISEEKYDIVVKKPSLIPGYDYSYGTITINNVELEFALSSNDKGIFSVSGNELSEIKSKASHILNPKKNKPY